MSDMERNKGKLVPTDITTEGFTDGDWDEFYEKGLYAINGKVYSVIWEVEQDTDCSEFADVVVNEDGTINFHTYHYNGGAHWSEVVGDELNGGN